MAGTATGKKPKPSPLTARERRLLKELPEHDTLGAALLAAGYSKSVATTQATRTINAVVSKSRELGNPLEKAFAKYGIDDDLIARKYTEGLEADKIISARVVEKEGGAADNDFLEVPDFPTRHKYLDSLHKVRGDYREKVEISMDDNLAGALEIALRASKKASNGSS